MKKCSKCGVEKDENEFYKGKGYKNGLRPSCKECHSAYQKAHRKTDEYKASQREYQKIEKWKEYRKAYKKTEKYKAYDKKYRNTEKYKAHNREYRKTKKQKAYRRKYVNKRRIIDPKYKLDGNMATAIGKALKGKKAGREWEGLVGYTIEDLMKHIESKFEDWMNWENYGNKEGKWSIDHIKPKSLFSYTSPEDEEFKQCWDLNNLQPLEIIENIKKSDKY